MNHENELTDTSRRLLGKITAMLVASRQPADPDRIIQSCCTAVLKLCIQNGVEKTRGLLEIIISYREHIVYNDTLFAVVQSTIDVHTSLALAILKSAIANSETLDRQRVMDFLLTKNAYSGVRYVLRRHFNLATARAVEPAVLSTDEFLKKLAVVENSGSDAGEFILKFIRNAEKLEPGALARIVQAMPSEGASNFEILKCVYTLNEWNMNARRIARMGGAGMEEPDASSIVTPKLISLTTAEILEGQHPENELKEFVALFSYMLLPGFVPLVEAVNAAFVAENKFTGLLRNIMRYTGTEVFIDIIRPVSVEKHCNIFKDVSNCDVSVFMDLYSHTPEDSRICLVPCLPGFADYCTDFSNSIDGFITVMKEHLMTHRSIVCTAIERMIYSHRLNLNSILGLKSPIERGESQRILKALSESEIVHDVVDAFVRCNDNECDRALELLVVLTGLNMADELAAVIIGHGKDNARLGLGDALRLMPFFISKWEFDYDLVGELLQLCSSAESSTSKKAYALLNCIYNAHRVPCICDMLFTSSSAQMHPAAAKSRIALLYTVIKRGCPECKCEGMRDRFSQSS